MAMFKSFGLVAIIVSLLSAGNAHALTYDLSLNPTMGPAVGTGTFTINGPVAASGSLAAAPPPLAVASPSQPGSR